MLARLHAAARLLAENRGSRPGSDAESGRLGLLLLHEVVAAEETVVAQLFGRGGALTGLRDPRGYDPRTPEEASWVPARVQVEEEAAVPGAPAGYAVVDRASSLADLAVLLEAAAELAWLASTRNDNPGLRDLVTGHPFGVAAPPRRGRTIGVVTADGGEVSFSADVKPLADASCVGCHNDLSPQGGYTMGRTFAEYDKFIAGGNVGRLGNPPNVVSGDHAGSLLWQVLTGTTTRVPRMPFGCGSRFNPCWSAGQISLVADWIDQGLRREPCRRCRSRRPGSARIWRRR
jgi:hypothetical protein